MSRDTASSGLVALVADRDIEETLARLFGRPESLGIGRFPFDLRRHPDRDAGCRVDAANFLRQFLRSYRHALVVFDQEGCGSLSSREEIEGSVEWELNRNGWGDRARAVVIDPELEAWVWAGSPVVSTALGWGQEHAALRSWLEARGLWDDGISKPHDPKIAMSRALRGAPPTSRRRRSPRLFGEIAAGVSLEGCQDPAFLKLRRILQEWFPTAGP